MTDAEQRALNIGSFDTKHSVVPEKTMALVMGLGMFIPIITTLMHLNGDSVVRVIVLGILAGVIKVAISAGVFWGALLHVSKTLSFRSSPEGVLLGDLLIGAAGAFAVLLVALLLTMLM